MHKEMYVFDGFFQYGIPSHIELGHLIDGAAMLACA